MRLLRYLDKKYTLTEYKRFIITFFCFGAPFGYVFAQVTGILVISWEKYNFSFFNLFFTGFCDVLICSPVIINYIRHTIRYNKIIKRLDHIKPDNRSDEKKFSVKALYDFKNYKKGESYTINISDLYHTKLIPAKWKQLNPFKIFDNFIYIENSTNIHFLGEIINKFELNDIKEDRRKKLKKLQKICR